MSASSTRFCALNWIGNSNVVRISVSSSAVLSAGTAFGFVFGQDVGSADVGMELMLFRAIISAPVKRCNNSKGSGPHTIFSWLYYPGALIHTLIHG